MKVFKNDKFDLTTKQIRAIELLVNCELNQKQTAEKCGVSERTLYNWMHHDEEFRNALEWYRREIYKTLAPTAVKTIADIMINGASEKARLAAAQDILSRAGDDAESVVDLKSDSDWTINVRRIEKVD
jgi:hypothetical protein